MLLLIDGNNLAHRCKHVFSLSNKGVDVSVTYGFLRVMNSWISKYKPGSVVVCWDYGVPDFRRQAVPEYKINRHKDEDPEAYEDFIRQMDELMDYALPMMGVVNVRKEGAEADDLLYHASRMAVGKVIIVTGDKDMLQAISKNVSVMRPNAGGKGSDVLYTLDNIEAAIGVPLKDYIDWRALQGDSSDNIPGVPGIGEITAVKLFKEYGSLTNIVNAAMGHHPTKQMTGKLAEHIIDFGWERISKNVLAMALYADRVGAKQAILEASSYFQPANRDRMKKYFMHNAFISLMDGQVYANLTSLKQPKFDISNMRVPVIVRKRIAYA